MAKNPCLDKDIVKWFKTSLDNEVKTNVLSLPFSHDHNWVENNTVINSPGVYYIWSSWDIGVHGHLFVELLRNARSRNNNLYVYRACGYLTQVPTVVDDPYGMIGVKWGGRLDSSEVFVEMESSTLRLVFEGTNRRDEFAEKWAKCHFWVKLR